MNNAPKINFFSAENIYKSLFKSILSQDESIDAEQLSNISLTMLEKLSSNKDSFIVNYCLKQLASELQYTDIRLEQTLFECNFSNPLGLAAGFDKNGIAAAIWDKFGFGFAELGTVTWHPQEGNPKPRLFRLAKEKGALNRMGFNNNGAYAMRKSLRKQGLFSKGDLPITIGLNFGKSKITSLDKASEDYASSLKILGPLADYAVINVSSPNTPGLRSLQEPKALNKLINDLLKIPYCPPLLIKIAPDLNDDDLEDISNIVCENKLAGIIAVNTSNNRLGLEDRLISQTGQSLKEEAGGLSGSPIQGRALEVIKILHSKVMGQVKLIGVGGIDSPQAAWERISAGASLIQIYTGWIFDGPILAPRILNGLSKQMDLHGFKNISEAVGSNAPWL